MSLSLGCSKSMDVFSSGNTTAQFQLLPCRKLGWFAFHPSFLITVANFNVGLQL